jgi:hypothetical protein
VAEGDGEAFVSFLVDSDDDDDFSFLVESVDDFLVVDFLVVEVLAGDFSGAVVVVAVSVLLVLQELMSPATSMTVME